MIRVLVADDEAPARRKLRRLLARDAEFAVVAEAADGVEAVEAIRHERPDVVFLDIQMPRLDGFGVIAEVGVDSMPLVVFVTAFDEHALRAFEVHALDYLLKPFAPSRFESLLPRLRRQLGAAARSPASRLGGEEAAAPAADALGPAGRGTPPDAEGLDRAAFPAAAALPAAATLPVVAAGDLAARIASLLAAVRPEYPRQILVEREEGRQAVLALSDIDLIRAEANYLRLFSGKGEFRRRGTLRDLEARLDPAQFLRLNRSEMVRLDAIRELQPWFHGDARVVLRDGTVLTWSRRYRAQAPGFL